MDIVTIVAAVSIFTAGITIAIGSIGPALGEGRAVGPRLLRLLPSSPMLRQLSLVRFSWGWP